MMKDQNKPAAPNGWERAKVAATLLDALARLLDLLTGH